MIDLSDGIATDAVRLARASGTGAVIELERCRGRRGHGRAGCDGR
jgi:thiamine monophosphate kinase